MVAPSTSASSTEQVIRAERIIAIIRTATPAQARLCAEVAHAVGIRCIEITFGTPGCLELVAELAREWPEALIGVGTVLQAQQARDAAAAGARFCVSPNVDAEVIRAARDSGLVSVPGAATPTEILAARRAGADLVKVFPIATLGGATYVRLLRGPLPEIPLVVTGGVRVEDVTELLAAGAVAVGGTGDLFPEETVTAGDRRWLEVRAKAFKAAAAPAEGGAAGR